MTDATLDEKVNGTGEGESLLQKGIESITAFSGLCKAHEHSPGDHCGEARKSLRNAILALNGYKSMNKTDSAKAEIMRSAAQNIYNNCSNEKCYECARLYLNIKKKLANRGN